MCGIAGRIACLLSTGSIKEKKPTSSCLSALLKKGKLLRAARHPVVDFIPEKEHLPYSGEECGGVYEHDVLTTFKGAKVLARWDDVTPAITLYRFGRGASVFTSARWLGLVRPANPFWPGFVRWGLQYAGREPAVILDRAAPEIEANLRINRQSHSSVCVSGV